MTKILRAVVTGTFHTGHWPTDEERTRNPKIARREFNNDGSSMREIAESYVRTLPTNQLERLWAVHVTLSENEIMFGVPATTKQVAAGKSFWWVRGKLEHATELPESARSDVMIDLAGKVMQVLEMHNSSYDKEEKRCSVSVSDACYKLCESDRTEAELLVMMTHSVNDVYDWAINVLYNRQSPEELYKDESFDKPVAKAG